MTKDLFPQKYSNRPLHIFGEIGLLSFFLGFLAEVWAIVQRFNGLSLNRNGWFFVGFFMVLAGVMFFSFGIIIDLLIRTHLNTSPVEKRYYVRSVQRL